MALGGCRAGLAGEWGGGEKNDLLAGNCVICGMWGIGGGDHREIARERNTTE